MTRAALLVVALVACAHVSARTRDSGDRHRDAREVSREVVLMGTRATLTTWDDERPRGLARLEALLTPLEDTEAALSTWRSDSEISRLNASAGHGAQTLSPAACRLFTAVDRWVTATDGAFDPSVGPIVEAWDLHGRGRLPPLSILYTARARSGWTKLRFDGGRCTIDMPIGALLDVGAFGKGEALDRARRAVGSTGPWLIDLGGQVAVSGVPPDARAWTIAIAHPHDRSRPVSQVDLTGGSLSTSAGSERDLYVDGRRVGHILDPRTGRPALFTGSVTVWSEEALAADILSTALFVMGPTRGLAWADAHHVAAMFAATDARGKVTLQRSRAWRVRWPQKNATKEGHRKTQKNTERLSYAVRHRPALQTRRRRFSGARWRRLRGASRRARRG